MCNLCASYLSLHVRRCMYPNKNAGLQCSCVAFALSAQDVVPLKVD